MIFLGSEEEILGNIERTQQWDFKVLKYPRVRCCEVLRFYLFPPIPLLHKLNGHSYFSRDQELSNLLVSKQHTKAIALALTLDRPFRVLSIFKGDYFHSFTSCSLFFACLDTDASSPRSLRCFACTVIVVMKVSGSLNGMIIVNESAFS